MATKFEQERNPPNVEYIRVVEFDCTKCTVQSKFEVGVLKIEDNLPKSVFEDIFRTECPHCRALGTGNVITRRERKIGG